MAALYALDRTPLDESSLGEQWVAAHKRFHEALLAACPNHRLRAIASTLRDAAELYRQWSRQAEASTHVRDVGSEHQALVDAVLAREADEAVRLLEAHLRTTAELLINRDSRTMMVP